MPYVDPDYAVADATASSDAYNILVDDVKDHEDRISAQAAAGIYLVKGSAQSIPNATFTSLTWASAPVELTGDWWSSGATITVPTEAVPTGATIALELEGSARFATNGTGARAIQFTLNGSLTGALKSVSADAAEKTTVDHGIWVEAADGDTIEMQVRQDSGGSLNVDDMDLRVKRVGVISP